MQTLLIDDQKNFDNVTEVARTYDDGIKALINKSWDKLLLDNDLGINDFKKTGFHLMMWLESNRQYCPKVIQFVTASREVIPTMSICSAIHPSSLAIDEAILRAKHFLPSRAFPPYPLP